MSNSPIPLPQTAVPAGAAGWQSYDAARWRALRPAAWAHPGWSLAALAGTVAVAIATTPAAADVCTEAAPCDADWVGAGVMTLLLAQMLWIWRVPGWAAATLPVLALASLWEEDAPFAADAAVAVAALAACVACLHRLDVARRQQALALEAAGPARHPLPARAMGVRRGRVQGVAGAVLLAAAACAAVAGLAGVAAQDAHAERATRLGATVTGWGTESLRVDLPDGGRRTVYAAFPEDYPKGSVVGVLVDGSWARLVAEPYDAMGWQLLGLAAAVPGGCLLGVALTGRRRAAELRRGPVPVLRVLARDGADDLRTYVYAADDTEGRAPVLACALWPAREVGAEADPDADDSDVELPEPTGRPLREALLYGAPGAGGEIVLVSGDADEPGGVLVECTHAPVAPAPLPFVPEPGGWRETSWGAGWIERLVGLALAVIGVGMAQPLVGGSASWDDVTSAVVGCGMLAVAARQLNWRVTADASGVSICGGWRVRRVPWDALAAVRPPSAEHGVTFLVRTADGTERVTLTQLYGPRVLVDRLRTRPAALRAVDALEAMRTDPALRPGEETPAGVPAGPVLVAFVVLVFALLVVLP
ncbi:hypothetical protein AB0M28_34420 [Streptomyces sp. NPDC051940]|uniref:hypothetical protein n=1 Tax=Streptomyces sp. NPDC051940 TaxID=3155675 RepID=UPI00342BDD37